MAFLLFDQNSQKILPIEKSLENDEHLIKSVWETEGTAPSPQKQKSRTKYGFFCFVLKEFTARFRLLFDLFLNK